MQEVLSNISSLSVTLLLLANFAVILNAQEGYKKLILLYGGIVAAFLVGIGIFYGFYGLGLVSRSRESRGWRRPHFSAAG